MAFERTKEWAIAFDDSGGGSYKGFGGARYDFRLQNIPRAEAHGIRVEGGSISYSLAPVGGSIALVKSWKRIPTANIKKAFSFDDLDGNFAVITIVSVPLINYSYFKLAVGDGPSVSSSVLFSVKLNVDKSVSLSPGEYGVTGGKVTIIKGSGDSEAPFAGSLDIDPPEPLEKPRYPGYSHIPPASPPPPAFPPIKKKAHIVLFEDVLFDFDSDRVKPAAEQILRDIVDALAYRTTWQVYIEGHTDSIGDKAYNLDLSIRRANAVKQWLVARSVPGAQLFIPIGAGETKPIASNSTAEGRAKNRRVEIYAT